MARKIMTVLALAGMASLPIAAAVLAQDTAGDNTMTAEEFVAPATPEEAVEQRQALMRDNGATLRSAGAATGTEAIAAMEHLYNNFDHIPDLFPEGSIVGDSKALPVIWENWEAFVAIADRGATAAMDGRAAAEAGDAAAYAAAVQTIGGACGECHQQFRQN